MRRARGFIHRGPEKCLACRGSGREGTAAAAAARCVRVLEREARAHHGRDIVDLDAIEILPAERIDEQLDAVGLQDLVVVLSLVLDVEAVLEARAAARQNRNAQARELYGFLRSMETLEKSFDDKTSVILSTDSELYKYLKRAN